MGLGSLGPAIGQALFARQACRAVGLSRAAYGKVFTLSMLTEALIETPVLFAFVVSIAMVLKTPSPLLPIKFIEPSPKRNPIIFKI